MKPEDLSAAPPPPPEAAAVFGDRLDLAVRYAGHLATTAVTHGLIGPREVPRLWERHVLNCAIVTDVLPDGATVADIGSGAGLPGITLALRRPDLTVVLIEPLLRRVTWLEQVIEDLGLHSVSVRRARAEELAGELTFPLVTARAVAPLERLVSWGLPVLEPHGRMVAIKGRTAAQELMAAQPLLERLGARGEVLLVGEELLAEPTCVVRITAGPATPSSGATTSGRGRSSRARRRL